MTNPIAKNLNKFNKPSVIPNKKKEECKHHWATEYVGSQVILVCTKCEHEVLKS
jgi:hypothetical protein